MAAAAVLAAATASGDRLVLKNGRAVEGVIREETPEAVVLDLGVGSTRIRREHIARIERSDAAERAGIRRDWAERYYLRSEFVPPAFRELGRAWRELHDRREGALAAWSRLQAAPAERAALEAERRRRRDALAREGGQLAGLGDDTDTEAYNRQVVKVNAGRGALLEQAAAIERLDEAVVAALQGLASYRRALAAFAADWKRRPAAQGEAEQQYAGRVDAELAARLAEFRESRVPVREVHGVRTVPVTLNGKSAGWFVLDSGAALMTVSAAAAESAGVVREPGAEPVELVLADGSRRDGYPAVIGHVDVGGIGVGDVRAVLLPERPGEGVDGLLGLSFLRYVDWEWIDGDRALRLTRFVPRPEAKAPAAPGTADEQ